jgi:hypothetical protein
MKKKILLLNFMVILLFATYDFSSLNQFNTKNRITASSIEKLKNDIYYFPAKKFNSSEIVYQPLERFDLIFVGHDINKSSKQFDMLQNMSALVPGRYTHVLAYIGKDVNGFAYAVEMNADENQTFSIDYNGLNIGGELYLFCLGNDFGMNQCPYDTYHYGLKSYDYMWAKRLKPKLKKQLFTYEDKLLAIIKDDLINKYPFQIPVDLSLKTPLNKIAPLVEDGHQNGSDCVSYFVSLFEEVAKICFDDIRMDALQLRSYYLYDPIGKKAMLPAKYNPVSHENIYMRKLLGELGYSFVNNSPRQTLCSDGKMVIGIPTPDLLFNSSSMVEIKSISK